MKGIIILFVGEFRGEHNHEYNLHIQQLGEIRTKEVGVFNIVKLDIWLDYTDSENPPPSNI